MPILLRSYTSTYGRGHGRPARKQAPANLSTLPVPSLSVPKSGVSCLGLVRCREAQLLVKYKVPMQWTFIEGLLCARHQVCLPPSRTFSQPGKRVHVSPSCEARDGAEVEVDGSKVAPAG